MNPRLTRTRHLAAAIPVCVAIFALTMAFGRSEVAGQARVQPMVTVAIRSDGSVESITFVVSSGVPAVDEAIRRMIESQKPYPRFSPRLASEVDVIEIRRTWTFSDGVRLY